MKFPVYRKYLNGLSWFKITGPDEFQEIRKVGSRYVITSHKATILPERNMLHDMLHDFQAFALEISEDEFENARKQC